MDEKEILEALSGLETSLEGKTKKEMSLALKSFGDELASKSELATKAQEEAFDKKLAEVTESLEIKMQGKLEESETNATKLQEHLNELDIKLKKKGNSEMKYKSFGERLNDAVEEKSKELEDFIDKKSSRITLELKAPGDVSTGNVTGGTRYGELFAPRIIELPKRKVHVRELIPGGAIGPGNSYAFMKQNGRGEGDPAPVAEGGTKQQFDVDLVEDSVDVENIAGWMRVTNKAMRNIPGFLSFLQSRIPERFERVMDAQMLYGTGLTNNLQGILTTGNFTDSTATISDPLIEKLITDLSVLEDTYEYDGDGIVLRPAAYYSFFKNKSSGSGVYDLPMGVTFDNGVLRLFGVPMRPSTAVQGTDYVVGNFNQGAQILTQEAMKIEFFREDGDNVRKNMVTIRVEGDYALPVYGPNYFIKGTTATS